MVKFFRFSILTISLIVGIFLNLISITPIVWTQQSYTPIVMWGSLGEGESQFSGLNDVISTGQYVYVPDYENHRIQMFAANGDFIKSWGSSGESQGQLNKPHSMTYDSQGNVYVTDMNNHRIQKFDSQGNFITMWGSEGAGDGQFLHPHGIGIDSQDNLYVTDAELLNVQKFDSDGNFITKWGSEG
jgi:tripartite motif-containing protein 71